MARTPPRRAEHAKRIPDIISLVKDLTGELQPAERRVADVVFDDVRFAIDASNAALAERARLSEPTVTRFCRAIGCEGVRDFKLKLAQSRGAYGALSGASRPPPRRRQRHAVLGACRTRRGGWPAGAPSGQIDPTQLAEGGRTDRQGAAGCGVRSRRQFLGAGAGDAIPAVPLRRDRERSTTFPMYAHDRL